MKKGKIKLARNINISRMGYVSEKWNMAFMFPAEIAAARKRTGLVILPVGPLEWHGPHLAMGCDNLLAHAFARQLAEELECPYFPPLFVGTERERDSATLKSIGFDGDNFIEGMDFPENPIASAYYREEFFALVIRDTLEILFNRMRFSRVLIINGHGAVNQNNVLTRLCAEYNAKSVKPRVMWVYPGFPRSMAGSIAHAGAEECSLLEVSWPGLVDISRLPQRGKLKNIDYAIVDSETFDLKPTQDHTVREQQDPRFHTDPKKGGEMMERAVKEVIADARKNLLSDVNKV